MSQLDITSLLSQIRENPDSAQQAVAEYLDQNPDLALADVEDAALDAFNAVYGDGEQEYSDDDLKAMQSASGVLGHVRTVRQAREAEAADRAQQARDLAAGTQNNDADGEAEQTGEDTDPAEPAEGGQQTAAVEPVAASSRTPSRRGGDLARLAGEAGSDTNWSITAAADINGIAAGAELPGMDALAQAAIRRLNPMMRLGNNVKTSMPIASLSMKRDSSLIASGGSDQTERALVDYAASERRLKGGSLTAAGVWCSPSETVYDLCDPLETTEGLLDLPSITVTRGGIRYPQSPDYSEVYTALQDGVWEWDPASDTNDPKPCLSLPCPDFSECRLTPFGLCIQTDILTQHAWPELVQDWTNRLLIAQQHLINRNILIKMVQGSTKVAFDGGGAGAPYQQPGGTSSILDILELQATYLRTKNRMSFTATLEVVLPPWTRPFIRADLAKRTGVDLVSVNDARVDSYFADRHLNVQYLYDFLDIPTDAAPTSYPWHINALMYPAGTWVAARQDVIELSGVYDSTLLSQNKFVGLFAEEAICVIKRCYESLYLSIDICPDGATSAPVDVTCPTV
ncbi:major capsid protein [Streptomyces sp. NPDC102364]|uniref:major capsid protein n=1 Tax=Streptomyces sp. NPDC102364 TaxID=3366161 RepID=UPI0037F6B015